MFFIILKLFDARVKVKIHKGLESFYLLILSLIKTERK